MGVLYDVLFKPIGRGDGGSSSVAAGDDQFVAPPEWVLDKRDGGPLVWRRHGLPSTHRKRVEFLDAIQVRVFERDDDEDRDVHRDADDCDDNGDGQIFWTDDWSCDEEHNSNGDTEKTLFYRQPDGNDYPLLFAASLAVLAVCVGLAYLFAPVKWLFHQLIVD